MKISNSYFFTKKEDAKDEESTSAKLLVRSGMIKKMGSGIYCFLPLGLRVFRKIEAIIREEMNNIGSQELVMPSLIPESFFIDSGRREVFGESMFALKDRAMRNYVLGPTHEELFVDVCRDVIKSYKDMPISIYQMANKYRDEARSRFGLIRTREFVMKDAYTFDKDEEGMNKSYDLMFDAYKRIFDRIGLNYKIIKASSGAMGGLLSEEFQAISDIGEDIVVLCEKCDLASNIEICDCPKETKKTTVKELKKEIFHTPNCKTIEAITNDYKINPQELCKTLIYKIDDKFYALMVRGDREVNEYKVLNLLKGKNIEMATHEEDEEITKAEVGYAGPIDLDVPVIIDNEVLNMKNFVVGANKTDYHYKNVNLSDFSYKLVGDIRNICEDDKCPVCGGKLSFERGIEVGNTFKLGTKYSEAMDLYFSDIDNTLKPVVMGCYGIGVARILAAVIEQNSDGNGIIFPEVIAPYELAIVVANNKDEEQVKKANELYEKYKAKGIEVLLDDRNVSAGIKFKDMDLIGIPKRITVGRLIKEGKVELKYRNSKDVEEVLFEDVI